LRTSPGSSACPATSWVRRSTSSAGRGQDEERLRMSDGGRDGSESRPYHRRSEPSLPRIEFGLHPASRAVDQPDPPGAPHVVKGQRSLTNVAGGDERAAEDARQQAVGYRGRPPPVSEFDDDIGDRGFRDAAIGPVEDDVVEPGMRATGLVVALAV